MESPKSPSHRISPREETIGQLSDDEISVKLTSPTENNHLRISPPRTKVITDEFGRARENPVTSPIRKNSHSSTFNRTRVSPVLMQCFLKLGSHPRTREQLMSSKYYDAQIQIYSWIDASLKEIAHLIADKYTAVDLDEYEIGFKSFPVTGDPSNSNLSVDLGVVHLLKSGKDDTITLKERFFKLGSDLLSVSMVPHKEKILLRKNKSPLRKVVRPSKRSETFSSASIRHRSFERLKHRSNRSKSPPRHRRPSYSHRHRH
ncbi:hypothetical protein HMI54_015024 [Coelomomyces lativittatus]|nr:hypothetical protein HMI54_015024 [Coelomomyces lativittatus]KAJ1513757.1 hypothetical protein HMI56_001822 [Coelomomyces lativittatus]KAJ1516055.1 hypothetical protein HMI55_003069 [Coelomomyces lativittatus]